MAERVVLKKTRALIRAGRAFLALSPALPAGDGAELAAALEALEKASANADGHLLLGLLGGTGVGKSTLISALAGEPVSPASVVRPTTSLPLLYRHRDFPPVAGLEARAVIHEAEKLRYVAVVDFPDFDSLVNAHHKIVLDELPRLDLALWVTDPAKYADRRFYEIMRASGNLGASAQRAVLNKRDDLESSPDGGAALAYVLQSFYENLKREADWHGPAPWPISASLGVGLEPLWELLESLRDDKIRAVIESENLAARSARLRRDFEAKCRPEIWLAEIEKLQTLELDYEPTKILEGEMELLKAAGGVWADRQLALARDDVGGLPRLFIDLWDWAANRFRARPAAPPKAPRPAAPLFAESLAGRLADLAAALGSVPAEDETEEALTKKSSDILENALEARLPDARPSAALLWLWPIFCGLAMVWAEAGGEYGPSKLIAALLRSLIPWCLASFLGDLFLSRFVLFRLHRRFLSAARAALNDASSELMAVANKKFKQKIAKICETRRAWLDALADLIEDDTKKK